MSNIIPWIAAVGESDEQPDRDAPDNEVQDDEVPNNEVPALPEQEAAPALPEEVEQADEWFEFDRRRRTYRGRTVALLRRYMRYSLETGRLPSLLGREFFRSKVTSYSVTTFEDRVIFVHDMEICLGRLDELSRQVLARIVLQEYEHEEAAQLIGCARMTIHRRLLEALDKMSDILLAAGLLEDLMTNP